MKHWTIYHNPKCSKSRQALKFLQDHNIEPVIIEYLKDTPLSKDVLKLIKSSDQKPEQFLRKKEPDFKTLDDFDHNNPKQVAEAIHQAPKIMERPIVFNGLKAVIARPTEVIEQLL